MAYHSELTKQIVAAKTGETIVTTRKPHQTLDNFRGAIQQARCKWKQAYGIHTSSSITGDKCSIYIIRGVDGSAASVATKLERKAAPVPPPAPPPPPEPLDFSNDEIREFFRDLYSASFQSQPMAPAAVHEKAAREGAMDFQRRFCSAPHGNG